MDHRNETPPSCLRPQHDQTRPSPLGMPEGETRAGVGGGEGGRRRKGLQETGTWPQDPLSIVPQPRAPNHAFCDRVNALLTLRRESLTAGMTEMEQLLLVKMWVLLWFSTDPTEHTT